MSSSTTVAAGARSAAGINDASVQYTFLKGKKPLDVVVVGGSCAGLMSGILLKRQGHNVRILEVARTNEREGTAAGIGLQAGIKQFLDTYDRLATPLGAENDNARFVDSNMKPAFTMEVRIELTNWESVYHRLRANFDAYKSAFCPNPPDLSDDLGTGVFETGKRVVRVEGHENDPDAPVQLFVEDVDTLEQSIYTADMVIAADGANSSIRRQLMPRVHRREPGYVGWRGVIPTTVLPPGVTERIEDTFWGYLLPYSYGVIYTVPGANGSLVPGTRSINFVWFTWETAARRKEILTDAQGHTHGSTLPRGGMQPSVWKAQLATARKLFHPDIYALISNIKEPFVSRVSNFSSPKASFFNGRLFLIGDALAQKQPNTALGASYAAKNALQLADVVAGKMTVEEWEVVSVADGMTEAFRSMSFASQYLDGWWGWALAHMRYWSVVARVRLWRWWIGK